MMRPEQRAFVRIDSYQGKPLFITREEDFAAGGSRQIRRIFAKLNDPARSGRTIRFTA